MTRATRPLLAAQPGDRPVDPLLQLLGLLFAVDRLFGVRVVDARHIDAAVPLVEPADGGVETARGDDRAGRRRARHVRQHDLLAAPGEPAGDRLYGSPLSMPLAGDELVMRPVGRVLQRQHRDADLGVVGPQPLVGLDLAHDRLQRILGGRTRGREQHRELDHAGQRVLEQRPLEDLRLALRRAKRRCAWSPPYRIALRIASIISSCWVVNGYRPPRNRPAPPRCRPSGVARRGDPYCRR